MVCTVHALPLNAINHFSSFIHLSFLITHSITVHPHDMKSSLHLSLTPLTPTSHNPSPLLSLNPAGHPHLLIHHKTPNNPHPAPMPWQISIKLIRHPVHLPQSAPRHGREIVMFIMQAHIIREIIENPVVGERLRDRRVCQGIFGGGGQGGEDIVLCDKMPRTWMQTAG